MIVTASATSHTLQGNCKTIEEFVFQVLWLFQEWENKEIKIQTTATGATVEVRVKATYWPDGTVRSYGFLDQYVLTEE